MYIDHKIILLIIISDDLVYLFFCKTLFSFQMLQFCFFDFALCLWVASVHPCPLPTTLTHLCCSLDRYRTGVMVCDMVAMQVTCSVTLFKAKTSDWMVAARPVCVYCVSSVKGRECVGGTKMA